MLTTPGYLYILCFDRPLGNLASARGQASHYLGWAIDIGRRLDEHAAGQGSAISRAAVAAGISWAVFYRPGTPELERYLKQRYKSTPCLCPSCAAARGRRAHAGFAPLGQLELPIPSAELDPFDFPPAPARRADWLEIKIQRDWRAARPALAPAPALEYAHDDLL